MSTGTCVGHLAERGDYAGFQASLQRALGMRPDIRFVAVCESGEIALRAGIAGHPAGGGAHGFEPAGHQWH